MSGFSHLGATENSSKRKSKNRASYKLKKVRFGARKKHLDIFKANKWVSLSPHLVRLFKINVK